MLRQFLALVFLSLAINAGASHAQSDLPPIEAYGDLPAISHVAISPDGNKVAFIKRGDDASIVAVMDLTGEKEPYAVGLGDVKADGINWAGNKHVIIRAFDTIRINRATDKTRYTVAFSINTETQKMRQLLKGTDNLFPNQAGLGSIIARLDGTNDVFMPAYMGSEFYEPRFSLLKVDLDTGRGRIHSRGTEDGTGWLVDTDGTVLAQEIYDNKTDKYTLRTKHDGKWETIHEYKTKLGARGLVGVTPDKKSLVMFLKNDKGFNELREMSFDGDYGKPQMSRDNTEIAYVLKDANNVVFGVAYGGLMPTYDFFDKNLSNDVKEMQNNAPNAAVRLLSWSDNFTKLIFYIEGSGFAGNYFLLDRGTSEVILLGASRPKVPQEHIGEVLTIEYPATDGLKIPGVMTVPNGSDIKNLPAIIMPHGGPETHDQVSFDWMAQYFASRGYLVLQPNFRGSDGFGTKFTEAGYGGWGGVMQQDITDGVEALKKGGMIDPERVCIVGWSYGGYAALAGGAFTPDLYKCVAAIAPVSDLPRLLYDEKNDHGKDHWVVSYWEGAIANGDATKETLRQKSPREFAENFKAPVLLIHGKDDLIVNINQSKRMQKALERADKSVQMITMRGEDHSLSTRGARLEALKALDGFIAAHIGPHSTG